MMPKRPPPPRLFGTARYDVLNAENALKAAIHWRDHQAEYAPHRTPAEHERAIAKLRARLAQVREVAQNARLFRTGEPT